MRRRGMRRPGRPDRPRRKIGAALVVTCLTIAATQSSWAVVVPVMPLYVQRFGASALQLGLVVALFGVGRLAANIPAGILSRRVDPRILLVASVSLVVVSLVATAFAPSMTVLLGLRLVTGLAGGTAITSGMIMVALLADPAERGRAMSLLQSMQLVGGSVGLMLGGVMYGLGGPRAPFFACGVLAVLVLLIGSPLLFRSKDLLTVTDPQDSGDQTRSRLPRRRVLSDRSFLSVCGICFAVFFHRFGGMQSIIPLMAYTVIGMGVTEYGITQGVISAAGLLLAIPVGILSDRRGRKVVISAGLLIGGLGLPLLAVADETWMFVAVLAVTALGVGACSPVQSAYVVDIAPQGRPGLAVGVFRSFGDLGGIIGPITLGLLTDHLGLTWAVCVLAAVMVAPTIVFIALAREPGDRSPPREPALELAAPLAGGAPTGRS